ncbi:2-hydroxyacid dehydrogenase [Ohtaekwangia sp.]|uniref:2-hydroxyacid dehydrogenase n=1 Tax=Ohtaekwangia sp. TaxID=2066019 RepID=UPI002FDEDB05
MRVFIYSAHPYEQPFLEKEACQHEIVYTNQRLSLETASRAAGFEAIAIFTADDASAPVLEKLAAVGVRYIALRSVGHDHVDLAKAQALGIHIANVPEYSPYAVAEHAVAMLMVLNRKITESRLLLQLQDYRLDLLTGFDVHGKIVGIVGTGKIGMAFASIMHGFGAHILAFDPVQNPDASALQISYVPFDTLLQQSDIISIHCPLNEHTKYLFSWTAFNNMKPECILINTARGGVIHTKALLHALENDCISGACLDVYEHEKGIFFQDLRGQTMHDTLYTRLLALKKVLITGHQAFLTREALTGIARTTMQTIACWESGSPVPSELTTTIHQPLYSIK